jgi:hypothetical protein
LLFAFSDQKQDSYKIKPFINKVETILYQSDSVAELFNYILQGINPGLEAPPSPKLMNFLRPPRLRLTIYVGRYPLPLIQ